MELWLGRLGWEQRTETAVLSTPCRVGEAFNTIKFFEETHCLNLQVCRDSFEECREAQVLGA